MSRLSVPPKGARVCLRLALAAACCLAAACVVLPAGARKPELPVEFRLRLLSTGKPSSGQPVRFEAVVLAQRPVELVSLDLRLPEGARWASGERGMAGRLTAGERRAVPLGAFLRCSGHEEIYARLQFRMRGGASQTRGAVLRFDEGLPTPSPAYRHSTWSGTPVLEYPAAGTGR